MEQFLAGDVVAAFDDAGQARVADGDAVSDAALAAKFKANLVFADAGVVIAQRGQAIRVILPDIFFIAHADERGFEQAHDRGKHFVARQAGQAQVAADAGADARQGLAKSDQAREFALVACFAPAGMIAILLAAAIVAPGGLQMAARVGADPDVGPGGWNHQRADALERRGIADLFAVGARGSESPCPCEFAECRARNPDCNAVLLQWRRQPDLSDRLDE